MIENASDRPEDTIKESLTWRARELKLRTKVLQSKLDSTRQAKEAAERLSKSERESLETPDKNQLKQLMLGQAQALEEKQDSLKELNVRLSSVKSSIVVRTKLMIKELWDIYPINEFPDRKGYSICDIHLPSSEHFEGHDETMVSVAIGYVGHLLRQLSDILDITLRFPVKYYGSKSLIYCNRRNQLFPLFVESFKSREWVNFSYGMSLLNLDIVQIRTLYGLSTTDPEDTLANLHSLRLLFIDDKV